MFLKNKKWNLLALSFLGFALVTTAQAAESTYSTAYINNDDSWKVEVAPYVWALNMNGTVQVRRVRAHLDQTFSDILSQLNWAGMVWVEASKDKFGAFANILYASLSDGASDRYISAKVNTEFGLYSGGLSYQVYKTCFSAAGCDSNFSLAPYLGFRTTTNDVKIIVNTPFGSVQNTNNKDWTDPLVGARFNLNMTKSWLAILAADIGGTNASSDYSYNLVAMLGFKPQSILKKTSWYLGYRLLDQHYATGTGRDYYNWNMKIFGPIASVSYTFG